MSVVRINVLEVPDGMGEQLEERFAARAGEVDRTDGFEAFELLRPTDGSNRYFVYTRWTDQASFDAWTQSRAFQHGHARAGEPATSSEAQRGPVASGSELLSFDVVLASTAQDAGAGPVGADEEE